MTRPCPVNVNAFVDLRACSAPPRGLAALARDLGGVLSPWASADDLQAALADALRVLPPRCLVIAGDDHSFGAFVQALLSPVCRALQAVEALPVALLDVGALGARGDVRRLVGLPSGGLGAQTRRLAGALRRGEQPLRCVTCPTLRVADSDDSRPVYGFWLGVGAHAWAVEQAMRLPGPLQRLAAPLRTVGLLRARRGGGDWTVTLDAGGAASVVSPHEAQGSLWVGACEGEAGGSLRAARGDGWRGMAPEVLWAGRAGAQAPFWEHPAAVGLRCDAPPDAGSAYVLDGALRFGGGQRVVEVTPGPTLTALDV